MNRVKSIFNLVFHCVLRISACSELSQRRVSVQIARLLNCSHIYHFILNTHHNWFIEPQEVKSLLQKNLEIEKIEDGRERDCQGIVEISV